MSDRDLTVPARPPAPVQIVSTQDVAALVEHCDATLARLEAELVDAEAAAEQAEDHLRAHPGAAVVDDEFEQSVGRRVEAHLADVAAGTDARPSVTPPPAPSASAAAVAALAADVSGETGTDAPTDADPTTDDAPVDAPPVASPAPEPPTRAERRPRRRGGTTVVTRRNRPAPAPAAEVPPAEPTRPVPVVAPPAEPEAVVDVTADDADEPADADEHAFWGADAEPPAETTERTPTRWPANLLVQLGIVLVIFALILLKLG